MCPTLCGRQVEAQKLMCRVCWSKVPQHLQAKVYATWRAYRRELTPDTRRAYRSATAAAIKAAQS